MKKVTLLLVMLLAFGLTFGFADETQVTFELDGSASATWGVNLDDPNATGFQNDVSSEIDIILVAESTEEKGEGDVYAWMELEDFEVKIDEADGLTVTPGDVSAMIYINDLWIDVTDDSIDVDEASLDAVFLGGSVVDIDDEDPYLDPGDSLVWTNVDVSLISAAGYWDSYELTRSGSVAVGYTMEDMFEVSLRVGSFSDWFGATPDENAYGLKFAGELTPIDGLEVNASAVAGLNYDSISGSMFAFGLGTEYELDLTDTISVAPFVGADIITGRDDPSTVPVEDDALSFEIGGGVKVLWPGFDDEDSNEFSQGLDDDDIVSGLSVGVNFISTGDADPYMNILVALYEDAGDESLIPGLGAQAFFEWYDVLDATNVVVYPDDAMGFGIYADYAVGMFMPYGKLTYDMHDDDVALTLGVEAEVIDRVTITLEYWNPRLMDMTDAGFYGGWAPASFDALKGVVTVETEVSW